MMVPYSFTAQLPHPPERSGGENDKGLLPLWSASVTAVKCAPTYVRPAWAWTKGGEITAKPPDSSPLYVNPANELILAEVLAQGKSKFSGGSLRQNCEPEPVPDLMRETGNSI